MKRVLNTPGMVSSVRAHIWLISGGRGPPASGVRPMQTSYPMRRVAAPSDEETQDVAAHASGWYDPDSAAFDDTPEASAEDWDPAMVTTILEERRDS